MNRNQDDQPHDLRPIPGHDGYYAGVANGNAEIYSTRQGGRLKQLSSDSLVKGYPSASLMVPGKRTGTRFYTHALVCAAYHGPRPTPGHEARHLDSNPINRLPGNLAWGLAADQKADRRLNGRGFGGPNCPRPPPSKRGRGAGKTGEPPGELRPIPGFEGYLAEVKGRIFSQKSFPLMELSLNDDGFGYKRVTLNGKPYRVCILVCLAFHGPKPSPAHEVLHRDNDPSNSAPENLRWGTKAENMEDRRLAGTLAGERHGRAKLTNETSDLAASLVLAGSRPADVGRHLGVDPNTARRAADRRSWGHRPAPTAAAAPLPERPQERARGAGHGMAKLTEETAKSLIRAVHSGRVRREAAAEHGVDVATANKVYRGALWPHLQVFKASLGPETKSATGRRPESARTAKLTREQVEEVRRLALAGEVPQPEIGRRYGISQAQVSSFKLGKAWQDVGI